MKVDLSAFEYLYRDGANFKQFETILLVGRVRATDVCAIEDSLEGGEFFIPEQVGLSSLQHRFETISSVPNRDDHAWHEMVELRPARSRDLDQKMIFGPLYRLVHAFCGVRSWDLSRSPLYCPFEHEGLHSGRPSVS